MLRASLVYRTTQAPLHADFSSASEVCYSLPQTDIADMSLEAGFGPLIQVFLSRFYPREKLGIRVGVWLAMAPLG